MGSIRPCRDHERAAILAIVNAAAEAYRGVIPADRWTDPYMPAEELGEERLLGHEVLHARAEDLPRRRLVAERLEVRAAERPLPDEHLLLHAP